MLIKGIIFTQMKSSKCEEKNRKHTYFRESMDTTLEVAVLGNHGSEFIFNEDMRVGALVMEKPLAPAKMASTTVEEYIIL